MEKLPPPSQKLKQQLQSHFPIEMREILQANASLFLMGSCFSDAMLERFSQRQISAFSNPFGTIYHPIPIFKELSKILCLTHQTEDPTEIDTLFQHQDQYHSLQHAHRFSDSNKKDLTRKINIQRANAHQAFCDAQAIIITLGTAFYYQHIPTQTLVGNCHKLPAQQFHKQCSTAEEIKQVLTQFFQINHPEIAKKQWIFTVSPVRHIRDGISENLQSKSTLIVALQEFLSETTHTNFHYFPAYEILREELSDWRFFKEDLMHPTAWAEDYIFQRFLETFYPQSALDQFQFQFKAWKQQQHLPKDTPNN